MAPSVFRSQIEEEPVIAATETEAGKRRLQLFDIAGAAGEVAIHQ
jgi:hypothetical protein